MHEPKGNHVSPHTAPPRGRVVLRALATDPSQEYLLYVPRGTTAGARIMVSVHGISRNALTHASTFARTCDQNGVVMFAPIFTKSLHKGYQRLDRTRRGNRVDLLLHQLLAEVAHLTGADATRVHLFGFSAGAQFAHRYAMAHPHHVARAVVAAAGWYTFPDPLQRYPYGIQPDRALDGVTFNPERFLRVPMDVLIGGDDTTMQNLRSTAGTVAQGTTRAERARNWVAAMRNAARTFGLVPHVTLTEVPRIGHSFTAFCERGRLVERVGRFLFGQGDSGTPYVNWQSR